MNDFLTKSFADACQKELTDDAIDVGLDLQVIVNVFCEKKKKMKNNPILKSFLFFFVFSACFSKVTLVTF